MNPINIIEQLKGRKPSFIGQESFKKSAVLIPLIEKQNQTHVLFEVRSMKLRSQPGDICFPGGRQDKQDKDALHCAIRETSEELGIRQSDIHDIVPLGCLMSNINSMIYPFVGRIPHDKQLYPNQSEVAEVFTVPLTYFLHAKPKKYEVNFEVIPEENFPFELIMGGKDYKWRSPKMDELFYQYDGKVIWGLTAKIIKHFVDILHKHHPNRI